MSYAELVRAGDVADPEIARFFQTMQERINAISTELLFFTLELNRLDDAALDGQAGRSGAGALSAVAARRAGACGRTSCRDDLEKLLHEKSVAGRTAWTRLFDETIAELRFPFRGRDLTEPEAMHLLSDRDGAVRQRGGADRSARCSAGTRGIFALITNTLAKDKEIEDRWRNFPRPISSRNLSNFVEDEVVDALIAAVRGELSEPVAPLLPAEGALVRGRRSCRSGTATRRCPSDDDRADPLGRGASARCCRPIARSRPRWRRSASASSPRAGSTRRCGRARRRAPSPIRPCRARTPICCSTTRARPRDVMTLAHELGHGVHQVLAAGQGP